MKDKDPYERIAVLWHAFQTTQDSGALSELYELLAGWLIRALEKADRSNGGKYAKDALSEAWISILEHPEKHSKAKGKAFAQWIRNVALNKLKDQWKKAANKSVGSEPSAEVANSKASEALEDQELEAARKACIDEFGGQFVEMERMKIDGMKGKEIAKEQGFNNAAAMYKHKSEIKKETIAKIEACVEEKMK